MPTPYAVGPVNAYLVLAEPLTLVDAGINTPQAKNALMLGLQEMDISAESIRRILITHAHPDHYGLVGFLQERSGATVYFPRREIARVRDRQMLFEVGRLLVEAGMPLELLFKMDQQRKRDPYRPGIDHDVVVPIDEGDGFSFETDEGAFSPPCTCRGTQVAMWCSTSRTPERCSPGTNCYPRCRRIPCWSLRSTSPANAADRLGSI